MADLENYIGKVQRIFENTTQSGKDYKVFEIIDGDGETTRFSVWGETLGQNIEEGTIVKYTFTQKGDYRNITKIEQVEQASKNTPQEYAGASADRETAIRRSVSLKAAVRLVANIPEETSLEERLSQVITISGQLEQYLLGTAQEDNGYSETGNDVPFKNGERSAVPKGKRLFRFFQLC